MSKAAKGTSTLFPQVSRGESADATKHLLDDAAGDSSGDEAHYEPRGDYAPPRPVTTQPSGELNQRVTARKLNCTPSTRQRLICSCFT